MAKSLAANLRLSNFNTTLVADHATVLHAFVLTAEALPIRYWSKNPRAEKSVAFGFERAVVDCFGLGHLTMRPLSDFLRGRK